jgi:phosphatidylglycerophosphatase A
VTATNNAVEAVPAQTKARAPFWAELVGTFFYAGRLKPGPGTWGSLAALGLWLLAAPAIVPAWRPFAVGLAAVAATAIGIPAATRVARAMGKEDPSQVVVDEAVGQWLALIAVPLHWKPLLVAFVLFRAFDITKPFPLRRLERLPEGTGIMMDDIGAGLYALAVVQLLLHFGIVN